MLRASRPVSSFGDWRSSSCALSCSAVKGVRVVPREREKLVARPQGGLHTLVQPRVLERGSEASRERLGAPEVVHPVATRARGEGGDSDDPLADEQRHGDHRVYPQRTQRGDDFRVGRAKLGIDELLFGHIGEQEGIPERHHALGDVRGAASRSLLLHRGVDERASLGRLVVVREAPNRAVVDEIDLRSVREARHGEPDGPAGNLSDVQGLAEHPRCLFEERRAECTLLSLHTRAGLQGGAGRLRDGRGEALVRRVPAPWCPDVRDAEDARDPAARPDGEVEPRGDVARVEVIAKAAHARVGPYVLDDHGSRLEDGVEVVRVLPGHELGTSAEGPALAVVGHLADEGLPLAELLANGPKARAVDVEHARLDAQDVLDGGLPVAPVG